MISYNILYVFKHKKSVIIIYNGKCEDAQLSPGEINYYKQFAKNIKYFSVNSDEGKNYISSYYNKNELGRRLHKIPTFYEQKKLQKMQKRPITKTNSETFVLSESDRNKFFPHLETPILPVHDREYFMPNYHDKI